MPNVKFFSPDDYALQTTKLTAIRHGMAQWTWRANVHGMPMQCARRYTTEHGAYKAGVRWLEKYIHNETL